MAVISFVLGGSNKQSALEASASFHDLMNWQIV
jgi:hypothetical protein